MREISLHLMDIIQNSIDAGASLIIINMDISTLNNRLMLSVEDNGCGIEPKMIEKIKDPFVTSRKTRKVGLGISLFEAACIRCGGNLTIDSLKNLGTKVAAVMEYNHIDRAPIGRIEDTIVSFIMVSGIEIVYKHRFNLNEFIFDSRKIKEIVGNDIMNIDIINWIKEYIAEGIERTGSKRF